MKAIAFAQRLLRDLKEKDLASLDASARLELLDGINGALQKLHDLAPSHSKIAPGAIAIAAPLATVLELTNGSSGFSGLPITEAELYCTIRIDGDSIDNQIIGDGELLHPFAGITGSHAATVYFDAAIVPEPYSEIISRPRILETGRYLTHDPERYPQRDSRRSVTEPRFYWVESNAINRNSPSPSILRFESLPDRAYRLSMDVALAPARMSFTDILSAGADIPMREEHIEAYLLPIARGRLTHSALWREKEEKQAVRSYAAEAEMAYALLVPKTNTTPGNRVGTPHGF